MLKSLSLQNFRGISALDLEDFSRVNIFLGTNGSGKTTVLEALGLAANPTSTRFLISFCEWREMPPPNLANDADLRSYFPNLDVTLTPALIFRDEEGTHKIVLAPTVEAATVFTVPSFGYNPIPGSSTSVGSPPAMTPSGSGGVSGDSAVRGLLIRYTPPNGLEVASRIQLFDNGFQEIPAPNLGGKRGCFYVHARRATSSAETADVISRLYQTKRESQLVGVLSQVDDRLIRLQPGVLGNSKVVFVDVGLPQLIQMNLLGDGFCRVALMASGLLHFNANMLIVDEIDSGLHHSVMKAFWRNATILARGQDRQIFCSTHSDEMLQSTIEAFAEFQDDMRIFRIDRHKTGQVSAQKYTYKDFCSADKSGIDIR